MTSIEIFIPLIIWGREKYVFHADKLGAYKTEKEAVHVIIDELFKKGFIREFEDRFEFPDDDVEDDCNKCRDNNEYIQILKNKTKTEDELIFLCGQYGDTYYENGWNIRIDNYTIPV